MILLDIKEKDGYMTINDLPHNSIFNKVRTGCGGTTIALTNEENYVIAVPTTELIINKCSNNENYFGFYGKFTKKLKEELNYYIQNHACKKIVCTYNKVPKLLELIDTKEYRLLVDEYHNLLKQYAFRDDAIDGVLDNFRKFKSFCFLSATPIKMEFKPEVLKDVPEYTADWKEEQKVTIAPIQTKCPYQLAANFINHYQTNGYLDIKGKRTYEAFFFLNSVKDIARIITICGLTNDDCRVICSTDSKNKDKLGDIEISNSLSPSKKFTFMTSKSFEGSDFFSETGLSFVISNVHVKHTLASIDLDLPQIAGRIRNKDNPFKNTVVHIFSTKNDESFISYEDYKKGEKRELELARERVDALNKLSPEAREQQAKEKSLYIRYVDGKFEVDDRKINYKMYEYKLLHQIYNSKEGIEQAYDETNISYKKISWAPMNKKAIEKYQKKPDFLKMVERYSDLKYSFDNTRTQIERLYPFINEAIRILGVDRIIKLRTQTAVKEAVAKAKIAKRPSREEMLHMLSQDIHLGKIYTKEKMDEICEKYGVTIRELKRLYKIDCCTKWINGASKYVYIITGTQA